MNNNSFKKRIMKSRRTASVWLSLLCMVILCGACGQMENIPESTETSAAIESSVSADLVGGVTATIPDSAETAPLDDDNEEQMPESAGFDLSDVSLYYDEPYAIVNDNMPFFTEKDLTEESFEEYSELDDLGRCGAAFACIGTDLMPTKEREPIGQVKPSGWQTVKYDNVNGKYLYNRCHLIGFQLSGENANKKNLITGTRYLNVEGMLPFENMVADYVKETDEHVLYRVTPVFEADNLLASGVRIEAYSVEDRGEAICFHVYCYNVQPGITIDYKDGSSTLNPDTSETEASADMTYILNVNSKKFHIPSCSYAKQISEINRKEYTGDRADLIRDGYAACKSCAP